jgi:D-alanyl-D-alanine carboxypeptidase
VARYQLALREGSVLMRDRLTAAVAGRGVAGVSIVPLAGTEPQSFWVPELDAEPAFLAYSITKTFTAALVLKLCEAGRLSLEDPLARWFPDIDRAERISVRRLLNHTAGIPDYGRIAAYHDSVRSSPSVPWSFERFAAETFEQGLWFEPGQSWEYSNPGYMLVKRIAETVAGASFRSLVFELITQPLGLRRTFVAESIEDLAALAPGPSSLLAVDSSPRDVRACYHPGWVSHGVVASTPSEVVRFLDALFRGQLLSARSLGEMTALVVIREELCAAPSELPRRWGRPSYGLGLVADPASPWGLILGHGGGGPCYHSSAFHAPDLGGASVCVMGAIEQGFDPEAVVLGLLDQLAAGRLAI